MSCTSQVKQQELLQNSPANPMGRMHTGRWKRLELDPKKAVSSSFHLSGMHTGCGVTQTLPLTEEGLAL